MTRELLVWKCHLHFHHHHKELKSRVRKNPVGPVLTSNRGQVQTWAPPKKQHQLVLAQLKHQSSSKRSKVTVVRWILRSWVATPGLSFTRPPLTFRWRPLQNNGRGCSRLWVASPRCTRVSTALETSGRASRSMSQTWAAGKLSPRGCVSSTTMLTWSWEKMSLTVARCWKDGAMDGRTALVIRTTLSLYLLLKHLVLLCIWDSGKLGLKIILLLFGFQ